MLKNIIHDLMKIEMVEIKWLAPSEDGRDEAATPTTTTAVTPTTAATTTPSTTTAAADKAGDDSPIPPAFNTDDLLQLLETGTGKKGENVDGNL